MGLIAPEDYFSDDLVTFMNKYREDLSLGFIIAARNVQERSKDGRNVFPDIRIFYWKEKELEDGTNQLIINNDDYYSIECKRLNLNLKEDKYVHKGLKRFTNVDYSKHENHAFMIGYVESGEIKTVIDNINEELKNTNKIDTINYLTKIDKSENFDSIYHSVHKRKFLLPNINIHHLMLDYTDLYVST